MGEKRRKFSREFKLDAVRMVVEGGHVLSEVARDLDLRADMLHRWQREFQADERQAFPGQGRLKADEEETRRLRRELECSCPDFIDTWLDLIAVGAVGAVGNAQRFPRPVGIAERFPQAVSFHSAARQHHAAASFCRLPSNWLGLR
jgi:transposase